MSEKLEILAYGIVILFVEVFCFVKTHARFNQFLIASALAALCLHSGFSGEQNSVLLGWIGLASAFAALAMFVVWIENSGEPELIDNADHKNPVPDPDLWTLNN